MKRIRRAGPDFFSAPSGAVITLVTDADEHDDALRSAAGLYAHESGRLIRTSEYSHLGRQGLYTSLCLLELLDDRKDARAEKGVLQRHIRHLERELRVLRGRSTRGAKKTTKGATK